MQLKYGSTPASGVPTGALAGWRCSGVTNSCCVAGRLPVVIGEAPITAPEAGALPKPTESLAPTLGREKAVYRRKRR